VKRRQAACSNVARGRKIRQNRRGISVLLWTGRFRPRADSISNLALIDNLARACVRGRCDIGLPNEMMCVCRRCQRLAAALDDDLLAHADEDICDLWDLAFQVADAHGAAWVGMEHWRSVRPRVVARQWQVWMTCLRS
jgi:hypothetical protein